LVSRQGFGEHETEQLGGHSQESNVTGKLRLMMMNNAVSDNPGPTQNELLCFTRDKCGVMTVDHNFFYRQAQALTATERMK